MAVRSNDLVLAAAYLALAVIGVLLVKLGLRDSQLRLGSPVVVVLTPLLVLGLAAYIGSFVLWLPVLARFDLSLIFPVLAGLAQVLLLIGSIWVLGETPARIQIAGALLVAVGVAMIGVGTRS